MSNSYEMLKEKFYDKAENVYKIPLGEHILKYDEKICVVVNIKEQMRLARMEYYYELGSALRKNADRYSANDFSRYLMDITPEIFNIYGNKLMDVVLCLISEYDIYDLTKDDFWCSKGGPNSTLRNEKNEVRDSHESPKEIAEKSTSSIVEAHDRTHSLKRMRNGEAVVMIPRDTSKKFEEGLRSVTDCVEKDVLFVLGVSDYFDEIKQKKSLAIVDNIQNGRIPENRKKLALTQAFQLNPFFVDHNDKLSDWQKTIQEIFGDSDIAVQELEKFLKIDSETLFKNEPLHFWEDLKDVMDKKSRECLFTNASSERNTHVEEQPVRWDKVGEIALRNLVGDLSRNFKINSVYFTSTTDKANSKISSACQAYGTQITKDEFPLACYDATLFGGADEGCIFTTVGIHIHTNQNEGIKFLSYKNIKDITIQGSISKNVHLNGICIDSSMLGGDDGRFAFVNLIKSLQDAYNKYFDMENPDVAQNLLSYAKSNQEPTSQTMASKQRAQSVVTPRQQAQINQDDWSDDWMNALAVITEKFRIPSVYFAKSSEKADRKIKAAWQSYGAQLMTKEESIIGCYDATVFGACDEGVLLTTRGLYIKTMYQDHVVFLPYNEIRDEEFIIKGVINKNLHINGIEISCSQMPEVADKRAFGTVIKYLQAISLRNMSASATVSRKCPKCGKSVAANGKFCTSCGSPIQ